LALYILSPVFFRPQQNRGREAVIIAILPCFDQILALEIDPDNLTGNAAAVAADIEIVVIN
jgi:hypothetical protein